MFLFVSCATASTPLVKHTVSSPTTVGVSIDHPVVTHGCGRVPLAQPGKSADETLPVNPAEALGRSTRTYRLHIPISYRENRFQALILVFHGAGGNAIGIENGTKFSPFANQHDIVVAYPQGLPDGAGGGPFWASDGPMDYGIDDVHYVSTLLDDLQDKLCIDAHRIFVTGFSNGGGMSGLLACRLAGRLAAAAPVSGNFYALPGGCQPARPFPILDVHGSADPVLPYQGYQDPAWSLPPIPQWLQGWAARDGCRSGPTIFLHTSQVTAEQWSACNAN
ncbi:MAG TPA: PHB depolymerase family esterase, partial [Ktedonobacteraceae bacterium]|nr:PHB depolymerase family esterase [Ktedonobacteraceae bacterium]